jgi:RNA polymerase sigma-70 factor (ECF subfamily)
VTDAELVQLARSGDVSAFGELVERHRTRVFRTALAACGSHQDAEEVAQDTFIVAWRTLDRFRGEAQFRTWVLAIAWRRALTRRRSIWRRLEHLARSDPAFDPVAEVRSAEATLMDGELARVVAKLVAALPVKFRDPLLLLSTGEWTYSEISSALNVAEGTVKWRVMEARRQLKRKLQALGYQVR